jgi:hypothetical protein
MTLKVINGARDIKKIGSDEPGCHRRAAEALTLVSVWNRVASPRLISGMIIAFADTRVCLIRNEESWEEKRERRESGQSVRRA